jgi:hypothetical protein
MLERLDGLIRRKATGDRESLANRLGVSLRTVTNLKLELEALGAEIRFDKVGNSYVYEEGVKFNWKIVDEIDDTDKLRGGRKISSNYFAEAKYLPWRKLSL